MFCVGRQTELRWIDIRIKTSATHVQLVAYSFSNAVSHTSVLRDEHSTVFCEKPIG